MRNFKKEMPVFTGMTGILFFILFNINSFSQNMSDPPSLFRGTYPVTTLSSSDLSYISNTTTNKFILGWNWASIGKRLDEALNNS